MTALQRLELQRLLHSKGSFVVVLFLGGYRRASCEYSVARGAARVSPPGPAGAFPIEEPVVPNLHNSVSNHRT